MNSSNPILPYNLSQIKKKFYDPNDTSKLSLYKKICSIYRLLEPVYSKLKTDLIYECDMLYITESKHIKGDVISYQPQLIRYDVKPTDSIYKRVVKSKAGICVHSCFVGEPLDSKINLKLHSRDVNHIVNIATNSDIFIQSSNYRRINFRNSIKDASNLFTDLKNLLLVCQYNIEPTRKVFSRDCFKNNFFKYIRMFINDQVKNTEKLLSYNFYKTGLNNFEYNHDKAYDCFSEFLNNRWYKDIRGKKTRGIENTRRRYDDFLETFKTLEFQKMMRCTHIMIYIKQILLDIFKNVNSKIGTPYIPDENGEYTRCGLDVGMKNGEGFALFLGNQGVKVVDRLDFSAKNLTYGKFQT
tara:strand:- start:223 stop:1287 length:1065 start_codon:yes stop_codon:yes gene_type:complete